MEFTVFRDIHFSSLSRLDEDMTVNYSRKDLDWTLKFSSSNRVVDYWNCLSSRCVSCDTINIFKTHVSVELDPEIVNQ